MSAETRDGQYIDAGGLRTYYEVTGQGDPLVLLHGGMCTIETFDGLASELASHHRVYRPERRGHGRTPDVEGPITFSVMAGDTIAFIDAAGIGRADVVGWSDGAAVAMRVALRRPDLVRRLVLIGQPVNSDGAHPQATEMVTQLGVGILPPFLRELYAAVSPDGPEHFDVVFERLSSQWIDDHEVDVDDLRTIQAPTLVVIGEQDIPTDEHAAAMRDALPDGRLEILPGKDHGFPMEDPAITGRTVRDFLAG